MNRERFLQILDAYGSRDSAWPAQERAAMHSYLELHPEAREALLEAREIDLQLDSFAPPLPDLSQCILVALPPPTVVERMLAWLFPGGAASLLRPALAGALPLLFGVALGLTLPDFSASEEVWENQERYLLSAGSAEVNWYD